MSDTGTADEIERFGNPAPLVRAFGWAILGALAALLVNNILILAFGLEGPTALLAGRMDGLIPAIVYVLFIGAAILYPLRSPDVALRWDARLVHGFNMFLLRGFFFGILFVGIADITIAFMRVEKIFVMFLDLPTARLFQRPDFVGLYIHFPLLILGFVLAAVKRKALGFQWLALMIIIAELLIVITRFVFSYQQAFMDDLVRYWYSALFLLASAYTLFEEGHVRVDIFYTNFSLRKKGWFNAFGTLFLGIPTAAVIMLVGLEGKESIMNGPVMNFEVTQTGGLGLYVKYQMAAFLGIFAMTMLIEFVSFFFEAIADTRGEPGHREVSSEAAA